MPTPCLNVCLYSISVVGYHNPPWIKVLLYTVYTVEWLLVLGGKKAPVQTTRQIVTGRMLLCVEANREPGKTKAILTTLINCYGTVCVNDWRIYSLTEYRRCRSLWSSDVALYPVCLRDVELQHVLDRIFNFKLFISKDCILFYLKVNE